MAKDPVNVLVITWAQGKLQVGNGNINPPDVSMAEIATLRQQVRGMGASIDKYDGTTNVQEWFFEFENLAAHQGLNKNAEKARLLSFYVTSEAKRRFHKLNDEQKASYEARDIVVVTKTPTLCVNQSPWQCLSPGDTYQSERYETK